MVDAAQTAGHLPISVSEIGADLLAAPGHKGLMGPQGTGFLYIGPGDFPTSIKGRGNREPIGTGTPARIFTGSDGIRNTEYTGASWFGSRD